MLNSHHTVLSIYHFSNSLENISNQCPERISRHIEWHTGTSSFTKLDESRDAERHCAHARSALARNEGGKKNARKGAEEGAKLPTKLDP